MDTEEQKLFSNKLFSVVFLFFQCDVFIMNFLKQYRLFLHVATAIKLRILF